MLEGKVDQGIVVGSQLRSEITQMQSELQNFLDSFSSSLKAVEITLEGIQKVQGSMNELPAQLAKLQEDCSMYWRSQQGMGRSGLDGNKFMELKEYIDKGIRTAGEYTLLRL